MELTSVTADSPGTGLNFQHVPPTCFPLTATGGGLSSVLKSETKCLDNAIPRFLKNTAGPAERPGGLIRFEKNSRAIDEALRVCGVEKRERVRGWNLHIVRWAYESQITLFHHFRRQSEFP